EGRTVGEQDLLEAGKGAGEVIVHRDRLAGRIDGDEEVRRVDDGTAQRDVGGVQVEETQRVEIEVPADVGNDVVAVAQGADIGVVALEAVERVGAALAV